MCILYYGRGAKEFTAQMKFLGRHEQGLHEFNSETGLDALRFAIATQRTELSVVVLAPPLIEELEELLCLMPLLSGVPIILLLPSDDAEIISLAHQFHPRYVTSFEAGLENAASVTLNILKVTENR